MTDLIDRQEAIDVLYKNHILGRGDLNEVLDHIVERLDKLPSAQPETHEERTETHACDYINRKDAIDAHYEYCNKHPDAGFPVWSLKILEDLPPAQPEHTNSCYTNSWCIDCKVYDTENKCCTRYNRVIKQTLDDAYRHGETEAEARFHAQQRWIPFKTRPLTEEEKEEHPEWDCILDCKLPDDGQAILVSIDLRGHESVQYDEFYTDDGSYLDSGYEIGDEAVAWMPLPEPYAERRTETV